MADLYCDVCGAWINPDHDVVECRECRQWEDDITSDAIKRHLPDGTAPDASPVTWRVYCAIFPELSQLTPTYVFD